MSKEFKQWIKSEFEKEMESKGFNNPYSSLSTVNRGLFKNILFTYKEMPDFIVHIIKHIKMKRNLLENILILLFVILFLPFLPLVLASLTYYFSLSLCKKEFECLT